MSDSYYSFTQNPVQVPSRDQLQFQNHQGNNHHQHQNQQNFRSFRSDFQDHRPQGYTDYSSHRELDLNHRQNDIKHNDQRSIIPREQHDNLATKQLQFSVNVNSISLPTKDMMDTLEEAREYRIIGENRTFYTRSTNLSTKLQTLKEKEKIKENKNNLENDKLKQVASDDKQPEGLILPQNDGVCEDESIADLFEIDKNNRYFLQDQKKQQVCRRCKQSGHLERMCLMEAKSVCNACLAKDHISNKCPQRVCFTCNQFGHINRDCPYQNDRKCHRCMKVGHSRLDCGAIVLARRANTGRDDQEVNDSDQIKVICQSCGKRGHINCRDTVVSKVNGDRGDNDGLYGKEFLERMATLKTKEENKRLAESLSDVNINDEDGQKGEDKHGSDQGRQQRKRRHASRDRDNRDDSCYEKRERSQSRQNPRKQFKKRSNSRSQSNGRRHQREGQSKQNNTSRQVEYYQREDHSHHNGGMDNQRQQHHYGQNNAGQGAYQQREQQQQQLQQQNTQNYQAMNYSREAGSYQQREYQHQHHYHGQNNNTNNNINNTQGVRQYHHLQREYRPAQNTSNNNNNNYYNQNNNQQGIGYHHDRQQYQQQSQDNFRGYERQQVVQGNNIPGGNQRESQGGYQYSSLTQPREQKQGYQYSSLSQRNERQDYHNQGGESRFRHYQ